MKSIFLIKSPLQPLNAYEARHKFNIEKEEAVLVLMADSKSKPQLLNIMAREDSWAMIFDLNPLCQDSCRSR